MNFTVSKRNKIFDGKVFDVIVDEIEYNGTGNKAIRQVALHPGGAVVVPVTKEGKIILVSQYRYPHNQILIELPAGKLEKGEDPLLCASRELAEETGFTSTNIIKLGKIFTTPGFCDEVLHIYLANDLTEGDHAREEGEEGMEIFELSLAEIDEKIRSGEIVDAKTICGIHYYRLNQG
ncbi:MAG: NUDIX hydrolase [Ignavibacteria bacterium]|jgi:ADP-ribose pyrophosphatase|nr:NUDIX hydrolase [Ignavibacteria bacterium]